MYRIIIAGSKTFSDYQKLKDVMDSYLEGIDPDDVEIITGGCRGANRLGEQYAEENSIRITQFLLEKNERGYMADTQRNERMVDYASEKDGAVVAFWDGRSLGTQDLIRHARTYMMDVNIINI